VACPQLELWDERSTPGELEGVGGQVERAKSPDFG
jgi:hypothetical protein